MSFENDRKTRMVRILEPLRDHPSRPFPVADLYALVAEEITKNRFLQYLDELHWAKIIIHNRQQQTVKLYPQINKKVSKAFPTS